MTRTTNISPKTIIHSNQNFSSYLKKKKKVSIFENEANLELNHQALILLSPSSVKMSFS